MKIFSYGHRQIEKDNCFRCLSFEDKCFFCKDKKNGKYITIPLKNINCVYKNCFYSLDKFSTNQFIKFDRKRFK